MRPQVSGFWEPVVVVYTITRAGLIKTHCFVEFRRFDIQTERYISLLVDGRGPSEGNHQVHCEINWYYVADHFFINF